MIEPPPPPGRYTALIAVGFVLTILAAAGLTTVYALGGQPQLEGALIFVMLGGLAFGFVMWGKHLMPQGPPAQPALGVPVRFAA